MHALRTTPEQHDLGLEIVRDQLLPWLRDSSGFRGLIRLWNPAESKTLVITLWADEESLRASAEAGDRFGEVTAGIDLSASTPSGDDEAFEGDPEAKLAEIGRLAQEQRALRRVATLVASEASPERVFTAVSEECARVLEVNASAVFRFEGDDT